MRLMDVHARILIETQCTGQVLGIYAQAYLAFAASKEFIERMTQQRTPDAAFSPLAAYSERSYPAKIRIIIGARAAEVNTRNFISIHGKEPERWIEPFIIDHEILEAFEPFFEGFLDRAEMVAERFDIRAVYSFGISLRIVHTEGDPFRPDGFRHKCIHVDTHVVRTADVVVAHIFEQFL